MMGGNRLLTIKGSFPGLSHSVCFASFKRFEIATSFEKKSCIRRLVLLALLSGEATDSFSHRHRTQGNVNTSYIRLYITAVFCQYWKFAYLWTDSIPTQPKKEKKKIDKP